MRAPPAYLRSNCIDYRLKVVKSHTFAADMGNTNGGRVRVRDQKGGEAGAVLRTERSEPLAGPDGEVQPNRHAQKQRSNYLKAIIKTLFTRQVKGNK